MKVNCDKNGPELKLLRINYLFIRKKNSESIFLIYNGDLYNLSDKKL